MSALFRSASTTAFDKLYGRHAAAVYRYARAVLGNHADAEDVTQQTFLNAYRALTQGTKPRKAENWLFTIAHNEVRRHLRNGYPKRLEVELDEERAHQVPPESSEPSVTDVLRALQLIPPNQRSALVMREFEGRSYAEIAEIMGVSQSALETLIFRARRTLAEALEDGLTCAEAELAVSRRLDGRLSRGDARRLKAHMRECRLCTGFEGRQKRQRSLLKGLSVIPVPASLFLFRGESASAAGGMVIGAAATAGSTGVVAKVAAVAAAVTVAGGVGYTAGADPVPVGKTQPRIVQQAALRPASKAEVAQPARPDPRALPLRSVPAAPKTRSRKLEHAAVDRPEKVTAEPTRAKRARKASKAADRASPGEQAASPPKAKQAKAHAAPKQPKSVRGKTRSQPRLRQAVEHLRPKPPKRARPEKIVHAADVAPSPALPPGREKQLLDPKPEKAKP